MNSKRKIVAVTLSALLLVLTVLFVGAETATYTGTVAGAETLLAEVDEIAVPARKAKKLDEIVEYLTTVNPADPALAAFAEKLDNKELETAWLFLGQVSSAADAATKANRTSTLFDFTALHPFADTAWCNDGSATITVADYRAKLLTEQNSTVALYLEASAGKATADDKHAELDSLLTYVNTYGFSLSEELDTAVKAEDMVCAKLYLDSVDVNALNANSGATLRLLSRFVTEHPLPTSGAELEQYNADFAVKLAAYEAKVAESKAALERQARSTDYSLSPSFNLDFDDTNDVGTLTEELNYDGNVALTRIGKETGMDGANSYYTVHYDAAKHFRTNLYLSGVQGSLVFECDITSFGTLPSNYIWCEDTGSYVDTTWSVMYFRIAPNGDIKSGQGSDSGSKVLVKNGVTPGKWTHISIVVDTLDNIMKLYVDYQLVEERSTANGVYNYTPKMIRLGASPAVGKEGGEFSIDNVRAYSGYAPRDINAVLTDSAKLDLFVSRFVDSSIAPTVRYDYYKSAKKLADTIRLTDPASASVAAFDAISAEALLSVETAAKNANTAKYAEYVRTLTENYVPSESTKSQREYLIAKIESYLGQLAGLYSENDDFEAAKEKFAVVRTQIDYENTASEFIGYVNAFYNANNVESQTEKYELALELMPLLNLDYLYNEEAFPSFVDAYERALNMELTLKENTMIDNSKKLLALIKYLGNYPTEEEWNEKYDFLKNYATLAREIINEGNYDGYYNNLDKEIVAFAKMNEFFYKRAQSDHAVYIAGEIARHDASSNYFEKYAITVMVIEYAKSPDVDNTHSQIAPLLKKNEENLAALVADVDNYEKLLEDNAALFVEKCQSLIGSVDYATMKRVCDEAAVYFYSMNVNEASAQDAIALYVGRRAEIRKIEANAKKFNDAVAMIAIKETPDATLAAIVEASDLIALANVQADGVLESVTALNAHITAYNESIAGINAEIAVTNELAAYLANTNGKDGLLTVILDCIVK
ncbi:MAG: hypothetical protein IJW48_04910 [Clostridia bacterium]|nr:hypothetical protein [Clostridia bacterium]